MAEKPGAVTPGTMVGEGREIVNEVVRVVEIEVESSSACPVGSALSSASSSSSSPPRAAVVVRALVVVVAVVRARVVRVVRSSSSSSSSSDALPVQVRPLRQQPPLVQYSPSCL